MHTTLQIRCLDKFNHVEPLRCWKDDRIVDRSITESSIEPLKSQLADIDRQINDQIEHNGAIISIILQNDERAKKLINSSVKT